VPESVRRTAGGDAWQARRDGTRPAWLEGGGQAAARPAAVPLGMPTVGAPARSP